MLVGIIVAEHLGSVLGVGYPHLVMTKNSIRVNGKDGNSAKAVKRTTQTPIKPTTQTRGVKDGYVLETKERERRLARLEALTIRAFQIAYENHHQK